MDIDILKARDNVEESFLNTGLSPVTKFFVLLTVLIMAGIWLDVRYLLPLLVLGLILAIVAKVPKGLFIVMITALLLTWYPTLRTTVTQANPDYYQVLDKAWAATPVATVNVKLMNLGNVGLTYGTLYWLAGRIVRYLTVVTWAVFFIVTTPMSEIANTMYALEVPYQIVFVFQMTYKFIPYMSSVINQISDAQKLRAWNMRTINPKKLLQRAIPIANPMIRRTAMIVDQVTIATQIRGFGSGTPTPMKEISLKSYDKVIMVIFGAAFLVAVVGTIAFRWGAL
jgi:energy-coupling factor transporter transmembrane protein EcfT